MGRLLHLLHLVWCLRLQVQQVRCPHLHFQQVWCLHLQVHLLFIYLLVLRLLWRRRPPPHLLIPSLLRLEVHRLPPKAPSFSESKSHLQFFQTRQELVQVQEAPKLPIKHLIP